jgi:predicted nucleic-acid-binding Zn-ribbon protein
MKLHPCPECASRDVYKLADVTSAGSHGPTLLAGLAPWYTAAKMTVAVCRSCGLTRFYASEDARKRLSEAKKWSRA